MATPTSSASWSTARWATDGSVSVPPGRKARSVLPRPAVVLAGGVAPIAGGQRAAELFVSRVVPEVGFGGKEVADRRHDPLGVRIQAPVLELDGWSNANTDIRWVGDVPDVRQPRRPRPHL